MIACSGAFSVFAQDLMAPAQIPPAGLAVTEVPQFVMIGFDDNPDYDAMAWIIAFMAEKTNPVGQNQAATFDGLPARTAFYSNGKFLDQSRKLSELHQRAWRDGHELGNHTYEHEHGSAFTETDWISALRRHQSALAKLQISEDAQQGFRTPYLEYNAATFAALVELDFVYDTSIEEGYQSDQDGRNFYWPYTLDNGSPGNQLSARKGNKELVAPHPGLWEIPLHVFIVPDDETCALRRAPGHAPTRAGWHCH